MAGSKKCPKCSKTKSVNDFHKDKTRKDGFDTYCKECAKKKGELSRKKYYCKSYFGMSIKEYEDTHRRLFKIQNGKCYLCGKSSCILRLDHNHKTGNVRTLLCEHCNLFVGKIEKDLDFVNSIIKYIEDFDV